MRYVGYAVIVAAGALAHGSTPAFAVQTQPALAWSFYVRTTNAQTLYNLGYNQGVSDKNNNQSSEVVLDFGVQWSDNAHTELTGGSTLVTYAQVENMAEQFAVGYWAGTGSDTTTVLRLAVGTNNSTGYESTTLGSGWANVAVTIKNWLTSNGYEYYGQENIWGANDIEPSWGGTSSQTNAENWANGYSSNGSSLYVDYGSADGCPSTGYGGCNNGWSQYGEYYVSWGASAAYGLPEIYYSVNASQWTWISTYAKNYRGGAIWFQGPLDDHFLDGNSLTPSGAWTTFWSDMNAAGDNPGMVYSCEIHIAS
ncbi:MAG: hypothetical protein ABI289_12865 [Candidatus Dormibacter sp.]